MHKNATKCKQNTKQMVHKQAWSIKIIDMFETYHAPAAELQPILLSWPFAQWGLDMVGKLHKSWPGGHVYTLVAVDKFTKWIEATPVTT
jgi:hypothetical protein